MTAARPPASTLHLHLLMLIALLTCACSRSESEWLEQTRADDPFVRSLAVVALGQSEWSDPDAVVDQLIEALGDSEEDVSTRAGEALLRQEQRVFPILLNQAGWPEANIRQQLSKQVQRLGAQAVGDLARALAQPNPPAGAFLVDLLVQLGPAGRQVLLDASQHDDVRVRRAALGAMAADPQRSDAASRRLEDAIDDESPAIRRLALAAVVRTACRQLEAPDPMVRSLAAARLDSLGGQAVREITQLLIDGQEAWQRPARSWLSARGPEDVTAFLATFQEGNAEMSAKRVLSLCEHIAIFGESALPILRRELTLDDPARRMSAAVALGGLGRIADAALPDLLARLDDEDEHVRMGAALAVLLIGVTDDTTLDALVLRAGNLTASEDERFARALGMAAVGGLLRQAEEADSPAATDILLGRLAAWGTSGRDWLAHVAQHALRQEVRLGAADALSRLDAMGGD